MMKNDEMVSHMAERGYKKDRQCFMRGGGSCCQFKQRWIALKEGQNGKVLPSGEIDVYYSTDLNDYKNTLRTYEFFRFSPPDKRVVPLWVMNNSNAKEKLWTFMGCYSFGTRRSEVHKVTKKGKPHTTHEVRTAKRVSTDLPTV